MLPGACPVALSEFQRSRSGVNPTRGRLLHCVFRFFFRIMSPVKNNVGRGLNIALVNGELPIQPPDHPQHALSTGGLGGPGGARLISGVRRGGLADLWEQKFWKT